MADQDDINSLIEQLKPVPDFIDGLWKIIYDLKASNEDLQKQLAAAAAAPPADPNTIATLQAQIEAQKTVDDAMHVAIYNAEQEGLTIAQALAEHPLVPEDAIPDHATTPVTPAPVAATN